MTGAIVSLQALLVKSCLLNPLLMNRKAFPICQRPDTLTQYRIAKPLAFFAVASPSLSSE